MKYIPADKCDEAAEAYRSGIPLDRIAGHLGISVAELRAVLELPALKPVPTTDEPDLWSVDRLDGVL